MRNLLQNSPELVIIKELLKYNIYIKYYKYIAVSKDLKEVKLLYHTLELLHSRYPGTDKSLDDLEAMVWASYPQLRQPEREAVSDLLERVSNTQISEAVFQELLSSIQLRTQSRDLALIALEVSEGRQSPEKLTEAVSRLSERPSNVAALTSRNFVTDDLFELEKHTIKAPGLRWRLKCLNLSLGPLRPGDFGFVFARPESGKTTFLASEITHFATQAERPIIWFNNEEQGEKVRLRTYQACLGLTSDQLWKEKDKNLANYRESTKELLKIYDDASIHKMDVERIISDIRPELVVFDQIDKIKGFDADRPDLVYGRIYQWARELAKSGCAVIGICQGDGSGEGVKWLTMSHVAEAKTSKQAEADWILGIGRSNEGGTEYVRFFNISKNKLLGDENTDPNERHGRFEVFIRPEVARYEDME